MNQRKMLQIVLWIATIMWLLLAMFLTLQSGEGTRATSNRVAQMIYRLFEKCGMNVRYSEFHRTLRTVAHFLMFCVFGLLLESAIQASSVQTGRWGDIMGGCVPSMVVCTILSVIPEVMKIWIPGRHLQWNEVLINVIGAYVGIFGAYLIWRIGWR